MHEPPDEKPRSILILTREEMIERVRGVLAMPSTGVPPDRPTEVGVGVDDGMPRNSLFVAANTLSAAKARLCGRITELGAARMSEVSRTLAIAAGCA